MKTAKKPLIFASFPDMLEMLSDENACRKYLENLLWNGKPVCPHCGSENKDHYELKVNGKFKGLRKCKDCRERFTVNIGTMFEGSHIPLRKWFIAIYIFSLHKKGISSYQLASDLGITQKSAWFMLGRIRNAFKPKYMKAKISGSLQADETFVGGKNRNRHGNKKVKESQGRSVKDKTPVFGILETGGNVHTQVVSDTKAKTIKPIIEKMVADGSIIVTDEWGAYNNLSRKFNHTVVKHNAHQYAINGLHTNGIENFWSHLKRGIFGIYHHVSPEHLHRYCDEFSYRFNSRKATNNEKFNFSLKNSERLMWKQLIMKK
jgi:transposase-like protein